MSDSRRSRVYEAEQLVRRLFDQAGEDRTVQWFGSSLTLPIERKFASVESVQAYVDKVLALDTVHGRYSRALLSCRVRERRGQRMAHYEHLTPTIAVPLHEHNRAWALRELVVLHELAHHLTPGQGHDGEFCEAFVFLAETVIGPEAGFLLRVALHENGAIGEVKGEDSWTRIPH